MPEAVLAIATGRADQDVAQRLAEALLRPTGVLARTWLAKADRLELSGSAGHPTGGGSYARLDGTFSRISSGHGKIGQIAATRTPFIVETIRGDESWLANPGWIARQGVRSFTGLPLLANDVVLGVIAIFDRARPSEDNLAGWEFLARYAAGRLADLRERSTLLARIAELESSPRSDDTSPPAVVETPRAIITRDELRTIEREALTAALLKTSGRVFGATGAAALLGMKPTTLASRMKALGIPPAMAIRRELKRR